VIELDNPVWHALSGPQQSLGTSTGLAAKFQSSICPFAGFPGDPGPSHWTDMATLLEPGGTTVLLNLPGESVPPEWTVLRVVGAIQMLGGGLGQDLREPEQSIELLALGESDVADMLALVGEARPGPFLPRTIAFGGYLGIRVNGDLIAMAGQRLGPPGFTEISAVATRSDHRRQGHGERLVRAVAVAIMGRGQLPFLHVSNENVQAIRLYESMGFTRRRSTTFTFVQAPPAGCSAS
jgi:ribosomal protein S18 acetylase RimI-like enzyme